MDDVEMVLVGDKFASCKCAAANLGPQHLLGGLNLMRLHDDVL